MSKSVEELFKDAPEDATHYAKQCHYKLVGDMWMVYIDDNEWATSDSMYNGQIKPSDIIQRPQPKPWSGPEDWLPPVGQECEVEVDGGAYEYCTVLAHGFDDFKPHTVVQCASGLWMEEVTGFRPIKTQEQIDRDQRETAIRELMDIAQVDCRVTAARLVDAGFARKMVRAEENRSSAIESMKKVFDSVSDELMPTSNKYLETLFGALCDAGFKREVV